MRIGDVLNEAPPGVSATSGVIGKTLTPLKQKMANRKAEQNKKLLAKQNQKKWYDAVKRKQRQGINMNDENTYRKELHNFVSGNKKLKLNKELTRLIGQAPLTDKTILSIMTNTIDARIAAKQAKAASANSDTGGTV